MNALLQKIYAERRVEDAEGNLVNPFPSAVPAETGQLLYDLVKNERLARTLEVGMGYGLSSQFICQAHQDKGGGSHVAIDPWQHQRFRSIGLNNLKKSGLDGFVQFHHAPSHDALPRLREQGLRLDLAFIDGMHTFDHTLVDFFYVDLMLNVGAYVVIDDLWMPSIRKVLGFILRNRAYQLIRYPTHRPAQPLHRVLMAGRRVLQNRLVPDASGTTFLPHNACVMKKMSDDVRTFDHYRRF
ncbi:MAG: class I SAM-dependent methyltransferase [Tepidisphaeraceae bacterium]